MRAIGIVGWSGSGKTALVLRLLPELRRRGLVVSTVKHAHHAFDVDTPGKDSYEHRLAGAEEVMVASANRWALMHEHRGAPEPGLAGLLARMTPVDLVLVEGFKREAHPKIEVWRETVGQPLLAANDRHIVAVASDVPVAGLAVPRLDLNDAGAVADFILRHDAARSQVA
jgi:molybdopterin-guanine dinucleotide biosynthesis protein B